MKSCIVSSTSIVVTVDCNFHSCPVFFLKLAKKGTANDSIWREGMGGDLIGVEQEKYLRNGLLFEFGDS